MLPLYSCAGKSGNRQETVAAERVIRVETGVPSDKSPVKHYRNYASSVIRSLRSVMTLRRALPAQAKGDRKGLGDWRFSIGFAPLTSITKSDAQISGGETRCGLKIPGVSPWWLPRAPPHSCLSVYRCHSAVMAAVSHSTPDTQFRVGSSLQAGLYARTPRSVRPLRLIR